MLRASGPRVPIVPPPPARYHTHQSLPTLTTFVCLLVGWLVGLLFFEIFEPFLFIWISLSYYWNTACCARARRSSWQRKSAAKDQRRAEVRKSCEASSWGKGDFRSRQGYGHQKYKTPPSRVRLSKTGVRSLRGGFKLRILVPPSVFFWSNSQSISPCVSVNCVKLQKIY